MIWSLAACLIAACTSDQSATTPERRAVAGVSLGTGTDTLTVGESRAYTAILTDAKGAPINDRPVVYTIGPTSVATITSAGLVTAVSPGTATVTATAEGVAGQRTLVIQPRTIARVDWSTIPAQGVSLEVGATASHRATARDIRGQAVSGVPIEYTSNDPAIATVDAFGTIRGISPGTTVIRARADTATATYPVRVITVSAALFPRQITTEPGMTGQLWALLRDQDGQRLVATSVQFRSSDTTVIRVSATGEVEARSVGTATVEATLNGRLTATTPVVVHPAPTNTLTITPIFEPAVPDYLRSAARRASQRAARLVLPGASWTPSERDSDRATRCVEGQTVRIDPNLWNQIQVVVTMFGTTTATAFGGPCVVRGSRNFTTIEGFPAVTSVLFSAPAAADIVTRLPTNLSTMIFEQVMLHEILHGLGFQAGYFAQRGVVADSSNSFGTAGALAAAMNLGYPPGPLLLSPDKSHWASPLYTLEVMNLSAGNVNRARLSSLTLVALQTLGFPVNLRAADITSAAELAGGALGEGPFGPVSPLAPNFTPSAILSGFRSASAVLLQGDVRHPPHH